VTIPTARKTAAALAAAALLAAAAGLTSSAGAQPAAAPVRADTFTLTILHNNDGESKLLPDIDAGLPGVARFAARMKELQAAAGDAAVVTLTSGDNFLASQELDVSLARDAALHDSIALSGLYDAMALGNHDFDLGPDVTARFIEGFDPVVPFLSANADFSGEPALQALVDDGVLAGRTTVETGGQQVGVIGAVTPLLPNISSPRNVVISDVLAAVRAEVASLTEAGVDKIILISHLQGLSEEVALVAELAGVDVVVAGGGDDLLRNEGDTCMPEDEPAGPYPMLVADSTGADVPVVTAPGGYRCIGELVVTFDGGGSIVQYSGRSVGVSFDVTPDPAVQSAVIAPLAEALAEIDADVIGASEVDLDGRRASVRTAATNQGSLLADALRAAATNLAEDFGTPAPDVAVQNGGGIRNDAVIPAGPVTVGDTWDIAPFRNFVVVGEVPRETFHVLLEQAVDRIPGAGGQFPQVSGFEFVYDPSAAARETDRAGDCSPAGDPGSRIRDVTLDDGTAVVRDGAAVPGDAVVLATVDFLADGGDCYPLAGIEFTSLGVSYRQALADYISRDLGGAITAEDYPEGDDRIVAAETGPEPVTVTVQRGDSLWRIARIHFGAGHRWREIFDRNRGRRQADGRMLHNPDLIRVGWVLELPAG